MSLSRGVGWLVALCWLLLAGAAQADRIRLVPGVDSYQVHRTAHVLEDASGALTLADVAGGRAAARFEAPGAGVSSFGFTDSAYWFRFDVDNPAAEARDMVLVLRTPWLDEADLYQPDGRGGFTRRTVGDRRPFAEREREHPHFLLDMAIAPGSQTYYLRLATKQAFMSPVELWEPQAFIDADRHWALYFGVLYGVVIVMLLYNGFIGFSIRDASYLYYCLYLAAFFMANFSYNGFAFQYLWPDSPRWLNWSYPTWILLFQFMFIVFAMVFLETRERVPRMHRVLQGYLVVMGVTWAASLLSGDEVFYNAMAVYFVFPYVPLAAIAGVLAWRAGYRAARFFILASMTAVIGAFISALTVSGFLPYSFASFHAVEFGVTADVVLLALALADRINFLGQQKASAEREAMSQRLKLNAVLERSKLELERTVAERTAELAQARDKAERLARTDGLTGVSNRRYFEEMAEQEFARARRYGQPLSVIVLDIDRFKAINDSRGHAAGDAVIKMVAGLAEATVRTMDHPARIGGEEFAILLPGSDARQASLTAERLREGLQAACVEYEGAAIPVTASFGVAQLQEGDAAFGQVLKRADQAMYASKLAGRNRVSVG